MPRKPKRIVTGELTVAPFAGDKKYVSAFSGADVRGGAAGAVS
jgi:hypothetical protein